MSAGLTFEQLLALCHQNCRAAARLSARGNFRGAARVLEQARNCVRDARRLAKGGA